MESEDEDCQCKSDEDIRLMFKKFKEFLRKLQSQRSKVKKDQPSFQFTSSAERKVT